MRTDDKFCDACLWVALTLVIIGWVGIGLLAIDWLNQHFHWYISPW